MKSTPNPNKEALKHEIVRLMQEKPLSKKEMVERLRMNASTLTVWLRELESTGIKIDKTGMGHQVLLSIGIETISTREKRIQLLEKYLALGTMTGGDMRRELGISRTTLVGCLNEFDYRLIQCGKFKKYKLICRKSTPNIESEITGVIHFEDIAKIMSKKQAKEFALRDKRLAVKSIIDGIKLLKADGVQIYDVRGGRKIWL